MDARNIEDMKGEYEVFVDTSYSPSVDIILYKTIVKIVIKIYLYIF